MTMPRSEPMDIGSCIRILIGGDEPRVIATVGEQGTRSNRRPSS